MDDGSPENGTSTRPKTNTQFLSERDLSLTVPINFVNNPGLSLTVACFPNGIFDDEDFNICLKNVLELGFRKLEIDIYWDAGRGTFSFCPAIIPTLSQDKFQPTPAPGTVYDQIANSSYAEQLSSSHPIQIAPKEDKFIITSENLQSTSTNSSDQKILSIGPYKCSKTLNLQSLISQLLRYLENTNSVLEAHLILMLFNLHSATFINSTVLIASNSVVLPNFSNLMGQTLSQNLSSYLYTPANLKKDRTNLNNSWYQVDRRYRTTSDYYVEDVNKYGIVSTLDGWPAESYIEFALGKRILLGWGSIDPQISGYNFSGDSEIIFPSDYLKDEQIDASISSTGQLVKGCFLQSEVHGISSVNSSWAVEPEFSKFKYPTSKDDDLSLLGNVTSSLTNCGISPFIYNTLLNTTAKDPAPYRTYINNTNWSWAPNEPQRYTKSETDNSTSLYYRCATTHLALSGRWTVSNCSENFPVACRADGQPYNWTISLNSTSFHLANKACLDGYSFSVPRTALENAYLTEQMRHNKRNQDENFRCWIAFESRHTEGCWVVGGKNNTCPYVEDQTTLDTVRKRTILFPTIAAIVILVLTAFTILFKAAKNRKEGRRLRRHHSEELEGVPG